MLSRPGLGLFLPSASPLPIIRRFLPPRPVRNVGFFMLQEMRKYAQSWVSSVFMGALALSFALWGIADIFRGNADTTVYSIGSTQVGSDLFAREFHNVMRNAGTTLTPDQTKLAGQQILDRMMTGTALDMIAAKLGLTATDDRVRAQIQSMQAFNGALGTFDHATFVQVIGRAGYNEAEFVAAIRKDVARDQMLRAIEGGYLMPPDYARAIYSYVNETLCCGLCRTCAGDGRRGRATFRRRSRHLCEGPSGSLQHTGISLGQLCLALGRRSRTLDRRDRQAGPGRA